MNYGFIYCLGNRSMPGVYKIGMTERAPAQRCFELSNSTSAPLPFDLLCFGQVEDPRRVEQELHEYFAPRRVNDSREFFDASYRLIETMIGEYSDPLAITSDGSEESERERLMEAFLQEKDPHQKLQALVAAARFNGIRLWREGGEIKRAGYMNPHSWIGGAIVGLRSSLIEILPDEAPVSRLLKAHLEQSASTEELDW